MGKTSGGNRTLKPGSRVYIARRKEVAEMIASGKYSSVTMSESGGGYVAIEKSSQRHKPEEIEAANHLANKGYKVILKDEAGQVKTPDGYLFTASFEQRTPTKDSATNIRNALFHARDKKSEMAVLYSKDKSFSRKPVEEGIKLFEEAGKYRFNRIIVIADNGHIHRHKHNV
jgi:hypothetical protein